MDFTLHFYQTKAKATCWFGPPQQ